MTKVLFMGRKKVSAEALRWLAQQRGVQIVGVITDSHLCVSPTRDAAEDLGLPVFSRDELESRIAVNEVEADLGLSVLYWQRIRKVVLDACRLGVVNFHPAPLPEYKGTAGYNLAILDGLNRWAVSAHYVDEGIDTGNLIEVDWFGIDPIREIATSLEAKCQPKLLALFKNTASRILGKGERLPTTPNIAGRYVSRAEMEQMKEVRAGDDVERKIRAFWFPPYDGAFVVVNGVKCTLVSRQILESLADPAASSLFSRNTDE